MINLSRLHYNFQLSTYNFQLLNMNKLIIFILLIFPTFVFSQMRNSAEVLAFLQTKTSTYPAIQAGNFLYVSLSEQRMYRVINNEITNFYIISGAKNGADCQSGSNKTPTGLHVIAAKYGDNVPLGGILKSRVYNGKISRIYTDAIDMETDDVTTRILWLKGEEKGINLGGKVDSYNRYVYIHGTPEEGLLGTPASHGCIRMKNEEVISLYDMTSVGTLVLILEN